MRRTLKRLAGRIRGIRQPVAGAGTPPEPDVTADPTPIPISKRTRAALILALLALFGLVVWYVPSVLSTVLGGFALALVLSFPVRWLSGVMRRGLAILVTFLGMVGLLVLVVLYLVPLAVEQVASLAQSLPAIASTAERYLQNALGLLQTRGLLPSDPEQLASAVRERLTSAAQTIGRNVVGGAFNVLSGTVSFAVTLFGAVFVGAYLLVDVRRFEAAFLSAWPHRYRRDAKTLWRGFGHSLSTYLGGLLLVLLIQGALSAVVLFLLGVPYALALGAFVAVAAIIPYLGAWLSAIPAVAVALTVSPTATVLTALLFLGIQQLESNFLTPKIQGDTLHVHPILVFLAVIVGGGLAGIVGVIVAVPSLAVLRVLFDFFRVRLTTEG